MSAIAVGVMFAQPASARPIQEGDYPSLPHEGLYQNQTACAGQYVNVLQERFSWGGYSGLLKIYYNRNCGAYIRADNMHPSCSVTAWRSKDGSTYSGWVTETSDGLTFAYTQVVNNLNGRLVHGNLFCGTQAYPIAGIGPF